VDPAKGLQSIAQRMEREFLRALVDLAAFDLAIVGDRVPRAVPTPQRLAGSQARLDRRLDLSVPVTAFHLRSAQPSSTCKTGGFQAVKKISASMTSRCIGLDLSGLYRDSTLGLRPLIWHQFGL
jgi:hypothetical protein